MRHERRGAESYSGRCREWMCRSLVHYHVALIALLSCMPRCTAAFGLCCLQVPAARPAAPQQLACAAGAAELEQRRHDPAAILKPLPNLSELKGMRRRSLVLTSYMYMRFRMVSAAGLVVQADV